MSLPTNTPSFDEQERDAPGAPSKWHGPATILAPLRVWNFCLLFSGQMISTVGDMFYAVALPWLMLSSGHTAQELGIVLASYGVPRVATLLLGGVLSDRWRPRPIMLLADIARAILVGILVVLVIGGYTNVWQLALIAAPLGAATGLFLPAYYAMLPEVLPNEQLQAGNALNSSSIQLAIFVGSALGGVVVSRLQPATALTVDALTFVVSAFTLAAMRLSPSSTNAGPQFIAPTAAETDEAPTEKAPTENGIFAPDITFWQLLRTWRLFQVAFLIVIFGNLTFSGMFEVALPVLTRSQFAAGANGYGLVVAAFGAGSLLGGLVAGMLGGIPRRGRLMVALIIALACWYTFVPYAGGIIGAALLIGCAGLTNGILTVLAFTILQQQSPRRLLGRVMAVLMVASLGLYPFSVALAGFISTHFGPTILFPLSGAMMLIAALFGLSQHEIRAL
jgi:MFS family permease